MYYQDDSATIYHGDCREIMPHLPPVDLLLTDPPYGIGEAGANQSKKAPWRGNRCAARVWPVSTWDDKPVDDFTMARCLSAARWQIVFGGNYYRLPPSSCWLVWDKDNGGNDFADCELAWTNFKTAVRRIRYRWNGMLQEPGRPHEIREHPTQKPLEVIKWALLKCPVEARTILDPFMGSGTTLRAAKDLGRKAIGIEIEERYCEIAAKRCAQEVLAL